MYNVVVLARKQKNQMKFFTLKEVVPQNNL